MPKLGGTNMRLKWFLASVLLAFMPAVSGQSATEQAPPWPADPSARAFLEVFEAIRDRYMIVNIDETALWQSAMDGMVAALPDRWSYHTDPALTALDNEKFQGAYGGVGMGLRAVHAPVEDVSQPSFSRVFVTGTVPGAPADLAGLQAGDVILEVDGVSMRSVASANEAVLAIVGPAGTMVSILVERQGVAEPIEFQIERGTIPLDIASSALLPDDVGYLALYTFFNPDAYGEFSRHLRELQAAGATALVLDLRDNSGGLAREGLKVLDEFLGIGNAWVLTTRGASVWELTRTARANDIPLVVLVGPNTISMGELLAASLQAAGRAQVVGEPTAGKGTMYTAVPLVDGGWLELATSEFRADAFQPIEGVGVQPDIWAPDTRYPTVVVAGGFGARAGQVVELSIDGVVVASAVADGDGFMLVGQAAAGTLTDAAETTVDLANDPALQVAVEAVKQVREGAAAAD